MRFLQDSYVLATVTGSHCRLSFLHKQALNNNSYSKNKFTVGQHELLINLQISILCAMSGKASGVS